MVERDARDGDDVVAVARTEPGTGRGDLGGVDGDAGCIQDRAGLESGAVVDGAAAVDDDHLVDEGPGDAGDHLGDTRLFVQRRDQRRQHVDAHDRVPLSAVGGFLRKVIGWRFGGAHKSSPFFEGGRPVATPRVVSEDGAPPGR